MVKVGIRKPNIKSSIKARTTGKAKRRLKKALIPGYGKKGMGLIRDPKKAAYNYVYHRTTVGVGDIVKAASKKEPTKNAGKAEPKPAPQPIEEPAQPVAEKHKTGAGFLIIGVLFVMASVYGLSGFEASATWALSEAICAAVAIASLRRWWSMQTGPRDHDAPDQ